MDGITLVIADSLLLIIFTVYKFVWRTKCDTSKFETAQDENNFRSESCDSFVPLPGHTWNNKELNYCLLQTDFHI